MKKIREKLLVGIAGVLLGIISYYLINGWYNIIPWAIIALAIGYFGKSRVNSIINGAIFGYFLFLAYIFIGYQGKTDADSVLKFMLFDFVFSLIGAVVGLAGGFGGFLMKKEERK
ncbi:MAG: hypothetical protein JWQ63_327 [Mucilaginibacter sp.]|nr:hypothetical protein [Mucilaginibacter sp.]